VRLAVRITGSGTLRTPFRKGTLGIGAVDVLRTRGISRIKSRVNGVAAGKRLRQAAASDRGVAGLDRHLGAAIRAVGAIHHYGGAFARFVKPSERVLVLDVVKVAGVVHG